MTEIKRQLTEHEILLIARALGDPRRYEILRKLRECGSSQPMACETVRECVPISPATLSHHMKELETAGLIRAIREGRSVSYTLEREVLEIFFSSVRQDLF